MTRLDMKIIIIFLALSNEVFWQKSCGVSSTHHPRRHSHLYIAYRLLMVGARERLRLLTYLARHCTLLHVGGSSKESSSLFAIRQVRQRSPCSKSETIAQNLLRLETRERERVILLSILRIWTGMLRSLSWPGCVWASCLQCMTLATHHRSIHH